MTNQLKTKQKFFDHKVTKISFDVLVISLVFLAIITAIEFGSKKILESKFNQSFPLLFVKSKKFQFEGSTKNTTYVEPHLGYARNPKNPRLKPYEGGYKIFGDKNSADYVVVALGGSTTDPWDLDNWPKQFQEYLETKGINTVVYNGGVSGYSSSQELLKILRDLPAINPDLVISLNGINDIDFKHVVKGHPFVHSFQRRMLAQLQPQTPKVLPNTLTLFRKLSHQPGENIEGVMYGLKYPKTFAPEDNWLRNIDIMHSVATMAGAEYMVALQPTLSTDENYILNKYDEDLLDGLKNYKSGRLYNKTREFFENAVPHCANREFCINIISTFSNMTGMYRDARHPNGDGYGVIARNIADKVLQRGLLQ